MIIAHIYILKFAFALVRLPERVTSSYIYLSVFLKYLLRNTDLYSICIRFVFDSYSICQFRRGTASLMKSDKLAWSYKYPSLISSTAERLRINSFLIVGNPEIKPIDYLNTLNELNVISYLVYLGSRIDNCGGCDGAIRFS